MEESHRTILRDYGLAIGIAIVLALSIRVYFIEAYKIPNSAMRPTLDAGDTIFVAKWPFKFGRVHLVRGEIVIFSQSEEPGKDYVKRIVGLPGETVQVKEGRILLNGSPVPLDKGANSLCGVERLPETAPHGVCFEPPALGDFGPEKVPEQAVFVLGDLRAQSKGWGMVPMSSLKAEALWIWLSIEPSDARGGHSWFPQFRFERMFKRISVPHA